MLQEGYMMSPSGFSDTSILEILHTISFPATNGWQDWVTFSDFPKIYLESGERKIRLMFRKIPFNLNWILFEEFDVPILGLELDNIRINVYPNPIKEKINIESEYIPKSSIEYKILDSNGRLFYERSKRYDSNINEEIELKNIKSGFIFLIILEGDRRLQVRKIIIDK